MTNSDRIPVLIIEDDPITSVYYERIINKIGAVPVSATSSESARKLIHQNVYPVIILDLVLPGLNGIEYCKELRNDVRLADTYIIIITSREDDSVLAEALAAGADDFISKPVRVKNLESRITIALANYNNRSARRKAEELGRFLLNIVESSIGGMLICSFDGTILFANRSLISLTSLPQEKIIGSNIESLNSPGYSRVFTSTFFEDIKQKGIWQTEGNCKSGESSFVSFISGSMVSSESGENNFLIQIQDISSQKEREAHLHYLVNHDSLTALENRSTFLSRLNEAISDHQFKKEKLAILYIDIDRFKSINDSMNHGSGDNLLFQFASRLKNNLPPQMHPARIGGDEFAVIIEKLESMADCVKIAEKVMSCCHEPYLLSGKELQVSVSVGIAVYPDNGEDSPELMRNADLATFRAKDENGNSYSFHSEEVNRRLIEKLSFETGLRRAIRNNELRLFLQPIVGQNREIVREEVLIRWQHPELGMVGPDRFIPIAEESGIIHEMGEWILNESCKIVKNENRRLAINISAKQLFNDAFIPFCESLCLGKEMNNLVEFEITESLFLHDMAAVRKTLQRLKDLGISLAIDDFGTGYSSFSYLKDLPIDILKVDRIFVRDIGVDIKSEAITRTIITLAHTLGMKVVAEGVETKEQFQFLCDLNCNFFQGYLFAKPAQHNAQQKRSNL